jgi:hypothetical protein
MKIVEIKNLTRKEFPIYYRRFYAGIVVIEMVSGAVEVSLEFQIEHKPTGQTEIALNLAEKIDYPLVPLQKEIKKYINALDSGGKLPNEAS